MKEKGKKSKHRKATAKPELMMTHRTEMFKVPESCLPCKALFISLFWKFKIIPYI